MQQEIGSIKRAHCIIIFVTEINTERIRKAIITTNAIESLNMSLRKVTKNHGSFPNDETVFKDTIFSIVKRQ